MPSDLAFLVGTIVGAVCMALAIECAIGWKSTVVIFRQREWGRLREISGMAKRSEEKTIRVALADFENKIKAE